jgi:hypothetical protein
MSRQFCTLFIHNLTLNRDYHRPLYPRRGPLFTFVFKGKVESERTHAYKRPQTQHWNRTDPLIWCLALSRRCISTGMKVIMTWSSMLIPTGVTSKYDFSFLNRLASWN